VWCAAWSPTGTTLATCSGDKTVRLWARVDSGAAHQPGQTPPAPEDETPNWACVATLEELHNRTIRRVSWCAREGSKAKGYGVLGV
jgi:WD40 repeat protein